MASSRLSNPATISNIHREHHHQLDVNSELLRNPSIAISNQIPHSQATVMFSHRMCPPTRLFQPHQTHGPFPSPHRMQASIHCLLSTRMVLHIRQLAAGSLNESLAIRSNNTATNNSIPLNSIHSGVRVEREVVTYTSFLKT